MTPEEKLKAAGDISPEYVDSAAEMKRRPRYRIMIAAAAAVAAAVGLFFAVKAGMPKKSGVEAQLPEPAPTVDPARAERVDRSALALAALPEVPHVFQNEEYYDYMKLLREEHFGAGDSLTEFYLKTTSEFLLSGKEGENTLYSPLNVYMALSMLAETTSGETREQILGLLSSPDMDTLRKQVNSLFISNYYDDDMVISTPAASLWINSPFLTSVKQPAVDRLASCHHASVFDGDFSDPATSELYRDWLNEQTHDLLADQINGKQLDPRALMSIVSTLYLKAQWSTKFYEDQNDVRPFHSPSGDEEVTFMNGSGDAYYTGNGYSVVSKQLIGSGSAWFILPDEGVSPDDIIRDGAALKNIITGSNEGLVSGAMIHLHMPKLDLESQLDLVNGLKRLGVTDCFDPDVSDFSELTDLPGIFVSSVTHGVRVKADENGVEAAAYTEMLLCGSAMPLNEVDFTLDRPFILVITGWDGTPLFVGSVYHPMG